MIDRELAINALRKIMTITSDVQGMIDIWPPLNLISSEKKNLEDLQQHNVQVYSLFDNVANKNRWDDNLQQAVYRFLLDECGENGLVGKKIGCLHAAGLPHGNFDLTYRTLLESLTEVREVPFLMSEMRAFNALGEGAYSTYQAVIVPIEEVYRRNLEISRFGRSDTLLAFSRSSDDIENVLDFAKALLARILECRRTLGLLEVVNLGISLAFGGCQFERLTGEPLPDSLNSNAPAWYQAAKLLGKAEILSKHRKEGGGIILVSDEMGERINGRFVRRNMLELDPTLDKDKYDCEVNVYDEQEMKAFRSGDSC